MQKKNRINRIALSTNGSASFDVYKKIIDAGINDFSISLDACCSKTGDIMAGKINSWDIVIENIKLISQLSYISVGIVLNEINQKETKKTIELAHDLGVNDIRIIPSSQFNKEIKLDIPLNILKDHPILKYRIGNKRNIRGMISSDSKKCKLVLDDMAVWNNEHYPCIIYLREQGKAIGEINKNTRHDRHKWYQNHDSFNDEICKKNCLDVCIQFNNTACNK